MYIHLDYSLKFHTDDTIRVKFDDEGLLIVRLPLPKSIYHKVRTLYGGNWGPFGITLDTNEIEAFYDQCKSNYLTIEISEEIWTEEDENYRRNGCSHKLSGSCRYCLWRM